MIMSEAGDTRHRRGSSLRGLRRLGPYLKPVRGRMIGSGLAVLCSMTCGLMIPLVFQRILDGPVAHRDTGPLLWLVLVVAVLGCTEALFFYVRRRLMIGPATQVEARMRSDIYHHLHRLPIAFHDGWQSGQLLSRASTDLSTLRRFIGFAAIFLVVNTITLALGLVVLFILSPILGLVSTICAAPLILIST